MARGMSLRGLFPPMLLFLALSVCIADQAAGSWLPETRLTYASGISYLSQNNARCFVADQAGALHLAWYDFRDGDAEIYYRSYVDGAWGSETSLTDNSAQSLDPALTVDASGTLHLLWVDYVSGGAEVYHMSFDGNAWTPAAVVTSSPGTCENPSLAADSLGNAHAAWREYRDGGWAIIYSMFDGMTWSADFRVSDSLAYPRRPCLACDDSQHVHVVWDDYRDGNWEIYYRRFDGIAWGPEVRLTDDPGLSANPAIAIDTYGNLHVFWEDDREGGFDIYEKIHDGLVWGADTRIQDSESDALAPSPVAGEDGTLHLVWYNAGGSEVYYRAFEGVSWGASERLSHASGSSENPMVTLDAGGIPHVAWQDKRDGNFEIYWLARSTLPPPEISHIVPDHGMAYTCVHVTDLAGSNFFGPVKVWLQSAGQTDVQATGEVVESPTQITCDFDLAYVEAGDWHVVVENADDKRDTLILGFSVQPLSWPQIYSIEPDSGLAFTTAYRTIYGLNFTHWTSVRLEMEGEDDIEATDITVASPGSIMCKFNLWSAQEGLWDVVVENPDGRSDTLVAGFRIIPQPPLEMTSITPSSGMTYEQVWGAEIIGHEFSPVAKVRLEMPGETDVRGTNVEIVSTTTITCDFSLTDAVPGYWDVVVQNPDGRKGILSGGFEVTSSLWGDEEQLTDLPSHVCSLSQPNARCVAVDGLGHVHVVWSDKRDGNYEIYYKSFDGSSWSSDLRLTNAINQSYNPAIAVDAGNNLHIVWDDYRTGDYEIHYMKFDGSSWGEDQRLTNAPGVSRYPSIATYGTNGLYLVWQDKRGGAGTQYVYFREHDGTSWLPEQIAPSGSGAQTPAIAVDSQGNAHVVWYRYYADDTQICYLRYDGAAWEGLEVVADADQGESYGPTVAAGPDDQIHVAWHRKEGDDIYNIYYRRFNGSLWTPGVAVTDDPEISYNPSIGVDPERNVHLVWSDRRHGSGNKEIYYARRDLSSIYWEPKLRLTGYHGGSNQPSMAVAPNGEISIVWRDARSADYEIYYKWRMSEALASAGEPASTDCPLGEIRISPNPVMTSTRIHFNLLAAFAPDLSVFDVNGRLVRNLEPGHLKPGPQDLVWNGDDSAGCRVAPGIYFLEISAGDQVSKAKVIVLR